MSLEGIPPKQKLPGGVVAAVRQYAAELCLPADWTKRIKVNRANQPQVGGEVYGILYDDTPFITIWTDILGEVRSEKRHVPIPPPVDPLVVATELALMQPSDTRFRRFNDCLFRVDAVEAIDGKLIKEGKPMMRVIMNSGKEYVCGNEPNYANSGMSTFEFFLQHVMNLSPDNANRIGHR